MDDTERGSEHVAFECSLAALLQRPHAASQAETREASSSYQPPNRQCPPDSRPSKSDGGA
jgi:hypothetical protein